MTKFRYLAAVAASAIALASAPAFAAGTASNTSVANTATLAYQTGGVSQNTVTSNTATFLVDRKVNLTVATVDTAAVAVVPGSTTQVTKFTVTNNSNAAIDIGLTGVNQNGGAAVFSGTDNIDVSNFRYAVDTNGDGVYTPGTDQIVTKLSNVAADASQTVFLLSDVPASAVNGNVAGVFLVGTAQELGTTTAIVATTGADNPNAVDTVLADGAGYTGSGDAASDGKASSRDQYSVVSAAITLTKIATTISDPINGTTNPKAIPGAVIEYCLIAQNSGAADATNVTVTDVISGKPITYVTGSGYTGGVTTGTGAATTCDQTTANGGTTTGASYATGTSTYTGAIGTVKAGTSNTARFRVTVN